VVPVIYGLVCLTPSGGSAHWETALLDSVYSIILGGTIMVIVTMLRHAAASVDEAQSTALERYSHAVRQHATEVERVQVDSIVHDSVLTTLLSAARAYTPEAKELAATMAGNAIGHLREAALVVPDDGSTVRLTSVARRITDAANSIGARFELRTRNIGSRSIPLLAGEAVYSASVQAMVNSLQHAGPDQQVSRWLTIRGLAPAGIEIEVGDTGHGFEIPEVPRERLGLRISIVERIANAGGAADIDSALGEGTVVTIRWPATPAEGGDDS
jgi:signal transduction histidine kinase